MERSLDPIVDEELMPEAGILPDFSKMHSTSRQSFPSNGFVLRLALRYDNNFASVFGAQSEAK